MVRVGVNVGVCRIGRVKAACVSAMRLQAANERAAAATAAVVVTVVVAVAIAVAMAITDIMNIITAEDTATTMTRR